MRELERRLEALLDRAGGQRWNRAAHASEVAGAIMRALDLEVADHLAPNRIVLPSNGDPPDPDLLPHVAALVEQSVAERGWRVEGPITLIPAQVRAVSATVETGPMHPWAALVGQETHEVTHNRAVVGRHSGSDVIVPHPSVSRRHAMLWRVDDRVLVTDLGSSNGTLVDGVPTAGQPVEVHTGSKLTFGSVALRLRVADDA